MRRVNRRKGTEVSHENGLKRTKRIPEPETFLGLRWQARDSGLARDTAFGLRSRDRTAHRESLWRPRAKAPSPHGTAVPRSAGALHKRRQCRVKHIQTLAPTSWTGGHFYRRWRVNLAQDRLSFEIAILQQVSHLRLEMIYETGGL